MVDLGVGGSASTALFGVFDGHAGSEAAAFCARHIVGRTDGGKSECAEQHSKL